MVVLSLKGSLDMAGIGTTTTTPTTEFRKRSKSRRIVFSERNYLTLRELGHTGDSFNDVISKLLLIYRAYHEQQQQQRLQQLVEGHQLHNKVEDEKEQELNNLPLYGHQNKYGNYGFSATPVF
jgi:hypothetical protein